MEWGDALLYRRVWVNVLCFCQRNECTLYALYKVALVDAGAVGMNTAHTLYERKITFVLLWLGTHRTISFSST